MSTLARTGHTERPGGGQMLLGTIAALVRIAILWQEIRSARRLMAAMPDSALSDIGVSRGGIDHATAFGRDRKQASQFISH